MTTPVLKKEYLDMIPEFSGEPTMLNRFISICDKIVTKFYVSANPDDFQNEYLLSTILTKLKGAALELVVSSNSYSWLDVRKTLLSCYLDKRDCYTLNLEMSELKQQAGETPFAFYEKIQKLLNLQIAYFVNKEPGAQGVMCSYVQNLALRVLLRGLHEPLGSLMRTKNPTSLGEALNMLTNDFQFKNNKMMTYSNKQNVVPKGQNNFVKRPFNATFNQNPRPMYQQPNPYYKPSPTTFGQLQRGQFNNNNNSRPQVNQKQPYQPTPMSTSTRQSDGISRQNPKLYQMTGRSMENNDDYTMYQTPIQENPSYDETFPDDPSDCCVEEETNIQTEQNYFLDQTEENHFLG